MLCILQQEKVATSIGKGPHFVTRDRLFKHLAFFCHKTEHRQPGIPQLDTPELAETDMQDTGHASAEYMHKVEEHWLSWQTALQNCQSIQEELQWCVQTSLLAEVMRKLSCLVQRQ